MSVINLIGTRVLLWSLLFTLTLPVWAEQGRIVDSQVAKFELQPVLGGLGIPWGLAFLSDNEIIVTERGGNIRLLNLETGKLRVLKGAPAVFAEGQAGMLDVAVPPDFQPSDWIYFTFVRDKDGEGVTVLARARLQGDQLVGWQDLLETQSATDTTYHFGSRVTFDETGHVYFGVGDRGVRPTAQDLTSHNGTVMRLTRDGKVPDDNPFINHKDALPEIWSYGHRNPQGIAYDLKQQRLWVIEHGPRGGDEINLVLPGRNYGWPVISYGKEYWGPIQVGEGTEREGMEQPVKQYTPSIAPGSLLLYTGQAFPSWHGNLFSGALALRHLNRVVINKQGQAIAEERLLEDLDERIRALAQSPQGWIYFSTDTGKLYCIKPATD
ncbi:MAG: PQQ-dependent sugar dehydrogenase [Thioalkalispiraceae bacterium]|jgi:glucose/arabinose dehydrogenase